MKVHSLLAKALAAVAIATSGVGAATPAQARAGHPAAPGDAAAGGFAPLDAPGPALDIPDPVLAASLRCSATTARALR